MIRLEPAGAEALLLVLAEAPDADLPLRIAALAERIRLELGGLLIDMVPGWTSLLLHYDLLRTDHLQLAERLAPLLETWLAEPQASVAGRLHEIPVWYAGADLASVAQACGLSVAEVVELHSAGEYRVGAIGFAPGFAYLGELSERLALPRLATPRTRVPAGSLAIAERQTAIYPQASPGGWHLLGLCPWKLFDVRRTPPCPLALGDRVRFVPIDEARYRRELYT
ncbi:5-oxoprolinase subunit PxpB [Aquipseudomonas alcaligenes]|uniref:Sensor histidine kinase inhibitor, KipI family n=1 Tax=Aquipseudomonas alcaligenes TaxID=43263 RepID=A0A1N6VT04_AQUAC|nr:5-oxoprolinase subunit PxpB [Pseudomonas alcaligenes]SIQ80979.1 sensor histidine kinase inhibitor, KipI family [Pseudomonas alcaligenes]